MDYNRVKRLARGRWFDLRQHVDGGGRTELFGPVHVSRPHAGTALRLGRSVRLYQHVGIYLDAPGATLVVGDGTYINRRTEITCKERVRIGSGCAISWDVLLTDTDYHQLGDADPTAPVWVGDHVWVGARSGILKGVTVGDGAVVAAGALVTRDVPPKALVAGTPAVVVRKDVTWR